MKRFFLIFCLFAGLQLNAQRGDSTAITANDSAQQNKDVADSAAAAQQKIIDENLAAEAVRNAGLPDAQTGIFFPKWFSGAGATTNNILLHPHTDSGDGVFFVLVGMTLLLGITRVIFPQQFSQLFQFMTRLYGYKKSAINNSGAAKIVSSLLLNLLFIITASWCIVWAGIKGFSLEKQGQYWAYAAIALAVVYLVKHSVVTFSGWIFDAKKEASAYNYVVFSINKIVGVLLVPIIILMTYCIPQLLPVTRFVLIIFAFLLLIYRYIASFILIQENSEANVFHFFLYLCAVEIMPVLLVYKLLVANWGKLI